MLDIILWECSKKIQFQNENLNWCVRSNVTISSNSPCNTLSLVNCGEQERITFANFCDRGLAYSIPRNSRA